MPSTSKAQFKFMEMMSYNKELAEKRNFDQETAREWHKEDMKKKKEDPEWWDNLPDHAPDKDKAKHKKKKKKDDKKGSAEESNEGVLDSLKQMFGLKKQSAPSSAQKTEEDRESGLLYKIDTLKIANDPKLEEKLWLKEGVINCADIAKLFSLKQWGPNWLSQVESSVTTLRRELLAFIVKRNRYALELEKIYKRCESMTPAVALEYATPLVAAAKKKLGPPPTFNLPLTTLKKSQDRFGSTSYEFEPISNPPVTMPVPDLGTIRKICKLIDATYSLDDDDLIYGGWTLDDTDEVKWWDHHFPNESDTWTQLIDLFPFAGDYYEYEIGDLGYYLERVDRGLRMLVIRSIAQARLGD